MSAHGEITQLINEWREGEPGALDRLVPLVYDDLRRIAHRHLGRQGIDNATVNTTALVHELYMSLGQREQIAWTDRAHFFAVASRAMRHILLDYVKSKKRLKRGGDRVRVPLSDNFAGQDPRMSDLLALDQALDRLEQLDERLARVVECRFFGGMSVQETASALSLATRTVERYWTRARLHLYRMLSA